MDTVASLKLYSALYNEFAYIPSVFEGCTTKVVTSHLPKERGIVILHGGADISPFYYKEEARYTQALNSPSLRDRYEALLWQEAQENGSIVVGICRGAQLANCLSGGKLYQDVSNHQETHKVECADGVRRVTNSYHHQMCIMPDDAVLLANSDCCLKANRIKFTGIEPEMWFIKRTKTFCIQGHPEWMMKEDKYLHYFLSCLKLFVEEVI